MLRGYYNAAQAMLVKQRELDTISNNIANVNTAGYRKDEAVLNTFMEELILVQGRREVSGTFQQTYVMDNKTNLEQSNFEFSESPYDVAIWGNVYFNVRSPEDASWAPDFADLRDGGSVKDYPYYIGRVDITDDLGYQNTRGEVLQTRNGQFELDGDGYLALNDGAGKVMRVQGQNGDIFLGRDDFVIDSDGVITNDGGVVDTLLLTYIPPQSDVQKIGNSLFRYEGTETLPAGETFDVVQGAFEKSNIDAAKETTHAIEVQRLYEANSKILQALNMINNTASTIAAIS